MLLRAKFLDATFDLLETLKRRIVHAEVHQVFRPNVRVVATRGLSTRLLYLMVLKLHQASCDTSVSILAMSLLIVA